MHPDVRTVAEQREPRCPESEAASSSGVGIVVDVTFASIMSIQPVDSTTFSVCMEQLQEGYVLSVAATAGCLVETVQRDIYGLDIRFVRQRGSNLEETSLHAQLKEYDYDIARSAQAFVSVPVQAPTPLRSSDESAINNQGDPDCYGHGSGPIQVV